MADEIIRRNTIITSISLIIVTLLSFFIISYANYQACSNELVGLSSLVIQDIKATNTEDELYTVINKYVQSQEVIDIEVSNSHGYILKSTLNDAVGNTIDEYIDQEELAKLEFETTSKRIYNDDNHMYLITKITDDLIVRTSIVYQVNVSYIYLCLFVVLIILIVTILVNIFFTKKTSKAIIETLEDIGNHLKTINEGEYKPISQSHKYIEVEQVLKEINIINTNIYSSLLKIRSEHNKLNYVYDNMLQGMIILDDTGKILLFNKNAKEMFKIDFHTTDKQYHEVINHQEFNDFISRSLNNKNIINNYQSDFHINEGIYACTINHLENKWYDDEKEVGAFVIMLIDVTEKRKNDELKAEFISNASHELKTPITSIRGFSELLLENNQKIDEDSKKYLSIIYNESIKMKDTIDELLYLSNLEYRRINNVEKEKIYLSDFIDESVQTFSRIAVKDGIKIKTDLDIEACIIEQPKLISHLINNLISNAVKYNKPNGEVNIKLYQTSDNIILEIQDTGIGIEEKNLSKIFERFYRVEESHTTQGTGIGLNIVKQICDIMEAEIITQSKINVGTTFTIKFKKSKIED